MDDNGISWDLTTMRIKWLTSNCPDPSPPSRFLREENNKLTLCSLVIFFMLKLAEMYYIYIHIMCMYIYIDTSTILCREPPPPCLPLWWPLLHCEAAAVILERMAFSTSSGRIEKNGMTNGFIYMNMV